jgi:hypothetical protein
MDAFARVVGQLGVKYVVVATNVGPDHQYYNVGAASNDVLEATNTSSFASRFAPVLIARYGPYELRQLSSDYSKPIVSLEAPGVASAGSSYLEATSLGIVKEPTGSCRSGEVTKVRSGDTDHFLVKIPPTIEPCGLVLRTAFSPEWQAVSSSNGIRVNSTQTFGFANYFPISASPTKSQAVEIIYAPARIVVSGAWATAATLFLLGLVALHRRRIPRSARLWLSRKSIPVTASETGVRAAQPNGPNNGLHLTVDREFSNESIGRS